MFKPGDMLHVFWGETLFAKVQVVRVIDPEIMVKDCTGGATSVLIRFEGGGWRDLFRDYRNRPSYSWDVPCYRLVKIED